MLQANSGNFDLTNNGNLFYFFFINFVLIWFCFYGSFKD